MKIKTSELIGPALDWAVAKIEGNKIAIRKGYLLIPTDCYSTSWAQGVPIIERGDIDIQHVFCYMEGSFSEPCGWQAIRHTKGGPINPPKQIADTPLIAAMRCYVASKLGDEVEVPDELT